MQQAAGGKWGGGEVGLGLGCPGRSWESPGFPNRESWKELGTLVSCPLSHLLASSRNRQGRQKWWDPRKGVEPAE